MIYETNNNALKNSFSNNNLLFGNNRLVYDALLLLGKSSIKDIQILNTSLKLKKIEKSLENLQMRDLIECQGVNYSIKQQNY